MNFWVFIDDILIKFGTVSNISFSFTNFTYLSVGFLNDDFSELRGFRERNCLNFVLFSSLCEFWLSVDEIFEKIATYLNFAILENESKTDNKMKHRRFGRLFVTFYPKSKEESIREKGIYQKGTTPFSLISTR